MYNKSIFEDLKFLPSETHIMKKGLGTRFFPHCKYAEFFFT